MKEFSKKLISAILLMGLILTSLSPVTVKAANDGIITVDNPKNGQTYTLYRVFDLNMAPDGDPSTSNTNYQYTAVNGTLETTIEGTYPQLNSGKTSGGRIVINVKPLTDVNYQEDNGSGQVVNKYINPYDFSNWLSGLDVGNFVVEGNPIEANQEGKNVKWENLPLGYYMVKSSLGSLVALNTTDKNVIIHEKNPDSENIKLTKLVKGGVKGDGTNETQNDGWTNKTYANIGETLEYKITFNVHAYANSEYVLEDSIPDGLDIVEKDGAKYKVQIDKTAKEITATNTVAQENLDVSAYTTGTDLTSETNKKLKITFPKEKIQEIAGSIRTNTNNVSNNTEESNKKVKTITITYTAKLNNSAQMSNNTLFAPEDGNKNTVTLTYDKKPLNLQASVDARTTDFNIFKFEKKPAETGLKDAKFKIYTQATGGTALGFVQKETEQVYNYINSDGNTEITTDATGKFNIRGLKPGTYYIEETVAPTGFNKIQDKMALVIKEDNIANPTKIKYTATVEGNESVLEDNILKIENQKGAELPDTGGMGRTMIYTAGGIIFFGALVLLIARKKTKEDRA